VPRAVSCAPLALLEDPVAPPRTLAVVGASLAGLRAVEAMRRLGFDGRIALIGAEAEKPYDRPPLSKDVLRGERAPETTALTKPESFDALRLELHLGTRATALDPNARAISTDRGVTIAYDGCLIATGAAPRRIPNTPALAGIHVLRTLSDCVALRAELERAPRVAVVGGGFIGAEVAATCRERGLEVTILEALPQPMSLALGADIGALLADVHRDHGVEVRCGVGVAGFEGSGGRVARVKLADGSAIDADVVVVGIGVVPETAWLAGSGLSIENGVVCGETLATSAPNVFAAGDVARWPNPLFGEMMRVEHWTNAVEQGEHAAAALVSGRAQPFETVPYVWSDQYDRKIMIAGRPRPDDEVRIVHGTGQERQFVALYGRAGRLVAALALNRARFLMNYRRMIRERATFEEACAKAAG
jgi:3-phenylpropionate/trans-cinnamate dioxygenase ferredoxin reductase subunit